MSIMLKVVRCRFGKSTHISIISNTVTHLRSYTNAAIAENSASISPVTPRDRWHCRAERRRLCIEHRYHLLISVNRMTSARSPMLLPQTQTSPHRALISSQRMTSVWVFHDVSQCFKSVSWCFTSGSRCFTMYHKVLHLFHDVLLCFRMFSE